MVKVIRKGKTYMLNKEEFIKYIFALNKKAKAIKAAKDDFNEEFSEKNISEKDE